MTFMIEFEEPSKDWTLRFSCPHCGVAEQVNCKTYSGKPRGFHHERIAVALNLELLVRRSFTYRIKA